jgi:hypothetical protein
LLTLGNSLASSRVRPASISAAITGAIEAETWKVRAANGLPCAAATCLPKKRPLRQEKSDFFFEVPMALRPFSARCA